MGVSMLPRLAAMVMRVTVRHTRPPNPAISRARRPKGTKVTKDTSLVITMLPRKQRKTRQAASPLSLPTRRKRQAESI